MEVEYPECCYRTRRQYAELPKDPEEVQHNHGECYCPETVSDLQEVVVNVFLIRKSILLDIRNVLTRTVTKEKPRPRPGDLFQCVGPQQETIDGRAEDQETGAVKEKHDRNPDHSNQHEGEHE